MRLLARCAIVLVGGATTAQQQQQQQTPHQGTHHVAHLHASSSSSPASTIAASPLGLAATAYINHIFRRNATHHHSSNSSSGSSSSKLSHVQHDHVHTRGAAQPQAMDAETNQEEPTLTSAPSARTASDAFASTEYYYMP